jgi:TM2 domain-containing membrane protein YozV
MYCKECGNQIADASKFCASCGKPQNKEVVSNPENSNIGLSDLKDEIKKLRQEEFYHRQSKSKSTALLLLIFLGGFGAHRFYAGKTGTGIVMLLFTYPSAIISGTGSTFQIIFAIILAIFLIWQLIDFISIITGSFIESNYYEFSETGQKNIFGDTITGSSTISNDYNLSKTGQKNTFDDDLNGIKRKNLLDNLLE